VACRSLARAGVRSPTYSAAVADPASPQPRQITISDHDVAQAHRLLILEFGSLADFDNPRLEYRRLFSETLGTFMLVLAAAGGGLLHAKGESASRPRWWHRA